MRPVSLPSALMSCQGDKRDCRNSRTLVSLACAPRSRAASQVACHVFSISPRKALHEVSKAGHAWASLSCCQPGMALQSALRQGGVTGTGGTGGLSWSGAGHTGAAVGGGQTASAGGVMATCGLACGADCIGGGATGSLTGTKTGATQALSVASSAPTAISRDAGLYSGFGASNDDINKRDKCGGINMIEDGVWVILLEAVVALSLLLGIVWATWPKGKPASGKPSDKPQHELQDSAEASKDESR